MRNLLTSFSLYDQFLRELTAYLDGESLQIQKLLSCLTLEPGNKAVHVNSSQPVYAPIVRVNQQHCILPLYGLEINPFLFLLKDLKEKFRDDWFKVANNREKRWCDELSGVFQPPRWGTSERGVRLRDQGREVTDVDFVAYDSETNEVGLFQLKWQEPVGNYGRANRSAAKNLLSAANQWISTVKNWLGTNGIAELLTKAGFPTKTAPRVLFFVLARYNAHFSGKQLADQNAVWADWPHFIRACRETSSSSLGAIEQNLRVEVTRAKAAFGSESCMMPLDDLAIIVNPAREPASLQ